MNGRYFSMFTGVGGFELGLGKRFDPVGFSEIDKYASELLRKRFPDNWTRGFSDTQRYKMMGNAVTVNVIKAIANQLNTQM